MAEIGCRHFNGYKPCPRSASCARERCASYAAAGPRILLVHLEALGAVLRSTSLVAAIRRRYPDCVITWVTKAPAQALLDGVVDRVLTIAPEDLLRLAALEFDVGLIVDKSLAALGVLRHARVAQTFGFAADPRSGGIIPATAAATELWELGLDDARKFFVNKKSEQQLTHEALELGPYRRDGYEVRLNPHERVVANARRVEWGAGRPVIGINTGCSPALPAKKLTVEGHRDLIRQLRADRRFDHARLVLLGGPEDTARNAEIARRLDVLETPTAGGLRDGLISVAATDLVFSGDSLGMHMAIGLEKWVVAWFGPSCAAEIDLFDRGEKIITRAPCTPCWKRSCGRKSMCYDQVDFFDVANALARGLTWLTSSSRPHSPEIFFSPSP